MKAKMISYLEKRLSEIERWIERLEKRNDLDRDRKDDLLKFKGARDELRTNLKYARSSRWSEE